MRYIGQIQLDTVTDPFTFHGVHLIQVRLMQKYDLKCAVQVKVGEQGMDVTFFCFRLFNGSDQCG